MPPIQTTSWRASGGRRLPRASGWRRSGQSRRPRRLLVRVRVATQHSARPRRQRCPRRKLGARCTALPRRCHRPEPPLGAPRCAPEQRAEQVILCAEEDSNLHPLSVDQALNLVSRVSDPSYASISSRSSAFLEAMDGMDDLDVAASTCEGRRRLVQIRAPRLQGTRAPARVSSFRRCFEVAMR